MLGIVPVKVKGRVLANDPLYASADEPGVAVSGYNVKCKQIDSALIGYAFQSCDAKSDNEVMSNRLNSYAFELELTFLVFINNLFTTRIKKILIFSYCYYHFNRHCFCHFLKKYLSSSFLLL